MIVENSKFDFAAYRSGKYSDHVIIRGDSQDALKLFPDNSIQCCVTSPPYWGLRDYGMPDQLGLEKTPEEYVAKMVGIFRELRRVLRGDGTLWLNMGDSYVSARGRTSSVQQTLAGKNRNEPISGNRPDQLGHAYLKDKDLCGMPWRVAFALQADGWWLRSDIIWHKPNPMPESVIDRPAKAHEYIFLLTKSAKYYYNAEAIAEPQATPINSKSHPSFGVPGGKIDSCPGRKKESGRRWQGDGTRNKRDVWTVPTRPFSQAHFATFPPDLIIPCILAGSRPSDIVLDPFVGAGTTMLVAQKFNRRSIGIELNPDYAVMAEKRLSQETFSFQSHSSAF